MVGFPFLNFLLAVSLMPFSDAKKEWLSYGGDKANTRYSPLSQIDRTNVHEMRIAWRWDSVENDLVRRNPQLHPFVFEATPLMVGDVLYTSTSFSQVAAIDATLGKTIWVFDPKSYASGRPTNLGFVHRGVAYWTDGREERILFATGDAYLIALDAKTGQPIPEFGQNGRIDLTQGLRRPINRRHYSVTSPPVVCRDVVTVGSSISDLPMRKEAPPGDVRGFDVRTGKLRWVFHTVPQAGEVGQETWENGSWQHTGNTNVWSIMSADEELGYIYLPVGTPTNDWYGGLRPGNNLFGETLVCLEAETGKRVWHFQLVHHGLWDYDPPAPPNLVDIVVDGKKIRAVAQLTKQGFCYVFDRVTGKPVWPIEKRPVPQSSVPGEKTSPTQPFPTKPPAFDRQGVGLDDLIDFKPELREEARRIIDRYDYGPLFTPPSEKGTVVLPGWRGGANWRGAAFDPETGILYVPSITYPILAKLVKPPEGTSDFSYIGAIEESLPGPPGLPLFKPPYGRVTAIDLNRGEHRWMAPLGDGPRSHPQLKDLGLPPLGWPVPGAALVTRTLLFVGQSSPAKVAGRSREANALLVKAELQEPKFRAFDKATGELLWEMDLPNHINGVPMTYMSRGKQFIVFALGGAGRPAELMALSLIP